jgi:hypothetical protein
MTWPEDHRLIADIVNARHPGRATYRALPGTDHGFSAVKDRAESFANGREGRAAPFREEFPALLLAWAREG